MNKYKYSSIVNEFIRTFFFLRKSFERTKTQINQKPIYKTKASEQKTIKATIFRAEKLLRGGKLFILRFGAFLRPKLFRKK